MKKTLQTQYLLIQEGKGHKGVFLADAKRQFPQYVPNAATYEEAIASLKTKSIINENFVGLEPIVGYEPKKKESFETAFEAFLAEARKKKDEDEKVKAEEKKVSKPVEEDLSHNYDKTDEKNPDNLIFDQIMTGYYMELRCPENADKTMQQLKDIVLKNLAKDPIYYTKNGQFGVRDLGYVTDHPGLGEPKEPKGKYASSGYGNLNESQEERDWIKDRLKKQLSSLSKGSGTETIKPKGEEEGEKESKIREVIRGMVNSEINEIFGAIGAFQASTLSGRGGDSMDVTRKRTSYDEPRRDDEVKRPTIHDVVIDLYGEEFSGLSDPKLTQQQKDAAWAEYKRIHGELEEAYQLVNIRPQVSDKERQERDPQEFTTIYLDSSVEELMKKNQHLRVLRNPQNPEEVTGIAIRARLLEPRNMKAIGYDVNPMFLNYLNNSNNIGGKIELPARDASKRSGMDEYFVLNNASVGRSGKLSFKLPNPKFQKPMGEGLFESVEKDLAAINKEAEYEVLQSKLDKIDDLIDSRKSKLNKLDEDEDMKALTDKKKVKELEKDIKTLEKAKSKVEKMLAKKAKNTPKKKQVIDEDEPIEEAIDDKKLDDTTKSLDDISKSVDDISKKTEEMFEENEMAADAPEGYLMAKADAEKRMDTGEELDSILSDYPEYRDELELDMMGKYDGMDY